jgi:hypothetical protein
MPPHMTALVPFLTATHRIRLVQISVPLVTCLLDGQKYFRPDEVPPPAGHEPARPPPVAQKPGPRGKWDR